MLFKSVLVSSLLACATAEGAVHRRSALTSTVEQVSATITTAPTAVAMPHALSPDALKQKSSIADPWWAGLAYRGVGDYGRL